MVDISEHIAYWRNGAKEDWDVANQLVDAGKTRHGMFFAHLGLEKLLKAHICRQTGKLAPKIYNLARLAELADLRLKANDFDILAEMNEFNLEGRYPLTFIEPPTQMEAKTYLEKSKRLFEWLTQQL